MKRLYRILLDCNAMSLFFIIYLIKEHRSIMLMKTDVSYAVYLVSVIVFTAICLFLSKFLPDEIISGGIKEVKLMDSSYLSSFSWYFFIALIITDDITLIVMAVIIFIFAYYSQTLYFNPLFLVFGYKFYYVTMSNGMKLLVFSRKRIRSVNGLRFDSLKRINDYTFIDRSHGN